jgi:hypothetical protein
MLVSIKHYTGQLGSLPISSMHALKNYIYYACPNAKPTHIMAHDHDEHLVSNICKAWAARG